MEFQCGRFQQFWLYRWHQEPQAGMAHQGFSRAGWPRSSQCRLAGWWNQRPQRQRKKWEADQAHVGSCLSQKRGWRPPCKRFHKYKNMQETCLCIVSFLPQLVDTWCQHRPAPVWCQCFQPHRRASICRSQPPRDRLPLNMRFQLFLPEKKVVSIKTRSVYCFIIPTIREGFTLRIAPTLTFLFNCLRIFHYFLLCLLSHLRRSVR